jgi:60S ribosome subunit biogenesis protein NIP7
MLRLTRLLYQEETRTLFTKLAVYTGRSLNTLITPAEDGTLSVFRLQGSRVYYVKKEIANLSISFPRDVLLSMGTMVGKFTKVSSALDRCHSDYQR